MRFLSKTIALATTLMCCGEEREEYTTDYHHQYPSDVLAIAVNERIDSSHDAAIQQHINRYCFFFGKRPFAAELLYELKPRKLEWVGCDGLVKLKDGHIVLLDGYPNPFGSGSDRGQ